jgi:hypothetical protein
MTMRFLTLYTPSTVGTTQSRDDGEDGQAHGHREARGPSRHHWRAKKRETGGLTVTRKDGKYDVVAGPQTPWMRANGYAILEAKSRDDVIEQVKCQPLWAPA